jgi:hypothetical protein
MPSHSSSDRTVTQLVKLRWNCSLRRRGRHTSKTSMLLTKPLVPEFSHYWDCDKWPSEMKQRVVRYYNEDEPKDDGDFVWFCPDRCKSMPYFDIKLTFDYWRGTEQYQHWYVFEGYKGYKWVWKGKWLNEVYWKGNSDYRGGFSPTDRCGRHTSKTSMLLTKPLVHLVTHCIPNEQAH